MAAIQDLVEQARAGRLERVVARMASGWAVFGEVQILPGYCLLLPDPVVPSLNDLKGPARALFLEDWVRLGDAVLAATGALRINYEILGNVTPELHAHVIPRYLREPEPRRLQAVWLHDWDLAPRFSAADHGVLLEAVQRGLV